MGRKCLPRRRVLSRDGACTVRTRKEGTRSLVGNLAAKGIGIIAHDAVVVDEDGSVLAGPRCVDLREGAADWLGLAEVPRRPKGVIELLALPIVIFRPPRRWESAEEATAALLDRVDG